MSYKMRYINIVVYGMIILWTILIGGMVAFFIYENYVYAQSLAKNEAIVSVKKDIAYRSWIASHGGVYVPRTEKITPNPLLEHVVDRDIISTSGQKLTLINPSQGLSEVMKYYSKLNGVQGHITSKMYFNKENAPDTWELKALDEMKKNGGSAVFSKSFVGDTEYFRYIEPFTTTNQCMKCHEVLGYKVGEVNGAVSVLVPMKKYFQRAYEHSLISFIFMLIVYIIGLVSLLYGKKRAKRVLENKIQDYEQHIFSLVSIIEKRDSYTAGHTQRVAKYSVLIAEEMGFDEDTLDDLHRASMLHDIGKISTPDSILLKPGKLSDLEYDIIKEHVVVSYELLSEVDIYKDIVEIIRHHHEHYDGSGYPLGLKGDEIPMLSHIMTVADSFDAITTNRIYKTRKSVKAALVEIDALAGKQFHAEVVKAALIALKDVEVETSITQRPKTKIEKERFSYFYKDQVTDAHNKDYLEFILAYNHADEFNIKCAYSVNLHNFNQYNKNNSWKEGDKLLKKFAKQLDLMNEHDYVFRIYGDDFIILNEEHYEIEEHISGLESVLSQTGVTITYKHIDIEESEIHYIEDLEKLL